MKLFKLILLSLMFVSCNSFEMKNFVSGKLSHGTKKVVPSQRIETEIRNLNSDDLTLLKDYLVGSKIKTYSYVLSEYYLELKDENGIVVYRFGIVLDLDGTLVGLNTTMNDPIKSYVTTNHRLLVNPNKYLEKELLGTILKDLPKTPTSIP